MGKVLRKILFCLAMVVLIPSYLIFQLLKFLLKPVYKLLRPVKQRLEEHKLKRMKEKGDVYITEDGIILVNRTRTRREKFITFITIVSTASFFLMVLAAVITTL